MMKTTSFLNEYLNAVKLMLDAKDEQSFNSAMRKADAIVFDARGTVCSYMDYLGKDTVRFMDLGYISRDKDCVLRFGSRMCSDMEVLTAAGQCPPARDARNENGKLIGKFWYGVLTTVYGDGRKPNLQIVEPEISMEKPDSKVECTPRADYYTDWFESYDEACKFMAENRK